MKNERINKELEILKNSLENKTILRGTIRRITKKNQIGILRDNCEEIVNILIDNDESTLYMAKKIKETQQKSAIASAMSTYVGKNIPFIITSIVEDEENGITVYASMKKVKEITLEKLDKEGCPEIVEVNILAIFDRYIVVEYEGFIQTIGLGKISKSDIVDLKKYIEKRSAEEINKFKAIYDPSRHVLDLDRTDLEVNRFKEVVIDQKLYAAKDIVLGKVVKSVGDGIVLIEIEEEVLGTARPDGEIRVKPGNEVKVKITSIDEAHCKFKLAIMQVM